MNFKHIVSGLTIVTCLVTVLAGCSGTSTTGSTTNQMGGAKQGKSLTLAGAVSPFAGQPLAASSDGIGASAQLYYPAGITSDGTNLYVVDSANHTIRKVVIASGAVTTLAGSAGASGATDGVGVAARFYHPQGITTDGTNLYVVDTDNHTIRKIVIATGTVTTLAGSAGTWGSTDGTGAAARFFFPFGITTDGTNLYIADSGNHTIRKVMIATGEVTTLAGIAGATTETTTGKITALEVDAGGVYSYHGIGTTARFFNPQGITTDGTNLYVADSGNSTIRKVVISTGETTTLAGSARAWGSTDGTGTEARFYHPQGITTDGTNIYVADTYNLTIRKVVIASGVVTTLAGSAGAWGSSDGTGAAARFANPYGITIIGTKLYVVDSHNHTIRNVSIATGTVTTLAGAGPGGSTDGTGEAARFFFPSGITTDGTNLYVADSGNHTIRKLTISTGAVTTLAGSPGTSGSSDGNGATARFFLPSGITTDGTNLYVADTDNHLIRKVAIATGAVTTLAGSAGMAGSTDGTGVAAKFYQPNGITTDGTNLFVADSGNNTIRKVTIATGAVTTLAGSAGAGGSTDEIGVAARFSRPQGITTDGTNLYVADTYNFLIRKVVIATGAVTTLAGNAPNPPGTTDGTGAEARFSYAYGITTDGTNLYVAESGTSRGTIRKIVIATGAVTTLAGGTTDASDSGARLYHPQGLTTDGTKLYVTNSGNNTINVVQ